MQSHDGWVSRCVVIGPNETVPLVKDLSRGPNAFWGFPGGTSEPGETQAETAIREVYEETGLIVHSLRILAYDTMRSYPMYLYLGYTDTFNNLRLISDDGEIVSCFQLKDLPILSDFSSYQRRLLHMRQGVENELDSLFKGAPR